MIPLDDISKQNGPGVAPSTSVLCSIPLKCDGVAAGNAVACNARGIVGKLGGENVVMLEEYSSKFLLLVAVAILALLLCAWGLYRSRKSTAKGAAAGAGAGSRSVGVGAGSGSVGAGTGSKSPASSYAAIAEAASQTKPSMTIATDQPKPIDYSGEATEVPANASYAAIAVAHAASSAKRSPRA